MGNLGATSAASRATAELVDRARRQMARLLSWAPEGVVIGPSSTALLAGLSVALAEVVRPGDEIVCSYLEHDANASPWLDLARRTGATVRVADVAGEGLDLPVGAIAEALSERTRVVALTAASNVVGTTPDIPAAAALAHDAGALLIVDAVHAVPHGPSRLRGCGADAIVCSGYKFFGPHVSILALAPELIDSLRPPRIRPAPAAGPQAWERGCLPFELLPGLIAAARYLEELDWEAASAHEAALLDALLAGLRGLPKVRVLGTPAARVSTVAFTVDGRPAGEVAAALAERRIAVNHGNFYAVELFARIRVDGALRAGLLHYNSVDDVDRLVAAVAEL